MQNIHHIGEMVMNKNNQIFEIMAYHPSISELYIVEDHNCTVHYMKGSVMISLR